MIVELLTEHQLELLSLKGGYTGSSESTLVKMPHCWISHVVAQILKVEFFFFITHSYLEACSSSEQHNHMVRPFDKKIITLPSI